MFEHIIKYLHQKDKSVLMTLAYNNKENIVSLYFLD